MTGSDENRASLLELQRELADRVHQRILLCEQALRPDFAQYEQEYAEDTGTFEAVSTFRELAHAVVRANVTLVADYHTLRTAQKTFVKIARRMRGERVVLALEFFADTDQAAIAAYLEGRISDKTLLKRTGYAKRWPYDIWPNFEPILELAKRRQWRVIGLDTEDHTLPLADRDAAMAQTIVDTLAAGPPSTRVVALVGELHLAADHLPARVHAAARSLPKPPRLVTVFQNVEPIYWTLAEQRSDAEVVRMGERRYCVLNTPPMVVHQSYLSWIDYDVETLDYDHLEHDFRHLVRRVARSLDVRIRGRLDDLRVSGPGDVDFWQELVDLDVIDEDAAWSEEVRRPSKVVSRHSLVYLGNLSINTVGETAARLLHCMEAGVDEDELEGFYARVIHEALSFFGSKVVNPKRKCKYAPFYREQLRGVGVDAELDTKTLEVAAAVLLHLAFEAGLEFQAVEQIWTLEPDVRRRTGRALGCMLGERLYYAYARGQVRPSEMRSLLSFPLDRPESAAGLYHTLSRRLRRVGRHPKRM